MIKNEQEKIVSQNKKATHEYVIEERYECGIVLKGTEIKAIRCGKVSLQDSYCYIKKGEIFISGMNISKYEMGNIFNHKPDQTRKLLLHKQEIIRLDTKVKKDGITIIPTKVYLKKGLAKVEIALAKGKKLYDKREDLKQKATQKELRKY